MSCMANLEACVIDSPTNDKAHLLGRRAGLHQWLSRPTPLDVWLAKEIGCHGTSVGANVKLPITQSCENRIRTTVPARPGERRVSIHVLRIDGSARIQEHLDGVFGTERCGAMERRFCLRPAITHEAARLN